MSALHDQELADVLEAERFKRVKRVRAACTTVPSIDPDEVAARIVHTIEQIAARGGGPYSRLPATLANRNKRSRQPLTQAASPSAATTLLAVPGTSPGDPSPIAGDEQPNLTTDEGRRNPGWGMRGAPQKGQSS